MAGFLQNAVLIAVAALSMFYVARTTCNSISLEGGFTTKTLDVVREYGGHLSVHNYVDEKMWSLIFTSWCLVFIYQFLSLFSSSSKGPMYSIGHIPWTVNALAIVGMFAHLNWLRLIHARDLFGSLIVATLAFYILVGVLMIALYGLYNKTPELKKLGLFKDVYIMRVLVINAIDFYCAYTVFNVSTLVDAYLIKTYDLTPENSNFYIMATLAFFQVITVLFDLYYCNWLLRYLAGGYITMIAGSVGIMMYQMVTLPHLPMLTLFNFVLSFLCPLVKIQWQSNNPLKEKTS